MPYLARQIGEVGLGSNNGGDGEVMACPAISTVPDVPIDPSAEKKANKRKIKLKSKIQNNVDGADRGNLQPLAASILMRLLYGSRYARFDLLKSISRLASFVSYWDLDCDKRLMRLLSYVKGSLQKGLVGVISCMMFNLMLMLMPTLLDVPELCAPPLEPRFKRRDHLPDFRYMPEV